METLLRMLPERPQPPAVRYGASTLIVAAGLLLRIGMPEQTGPYGFILLIPGIVAAAILFDRGTGFYALALSMLGVSLLLWRKGDFVHTHVGAFVIFGLIGSGLVLMAEGLRKALERAWRAEREKELLLEELQHRMKNTFAMTHSMLTLQARAEPDGAAKHALEAAVSRLRVMFDAHEYLVPTSRQERIEMRGYLENVCHSLGDALRGVRPVAVRVNADPLLVRSQKAVPIGLIANELVTNAFKHAFPGEQEGAIIVTFSEVPGGILQLAVQDDGVGCPQEPADGLGSKIVRLLIRQLGGSILRENVTRGCRVVVRIPRRTLA